MATFLYKLITILVVLCSQYTGSVPVVSYQGDQDIDITNTPSLTTQWNISYNLIGLLQQQLNSTLYSVQQVQCVCECIALHVLCTLQVVNDTQQPSRMCFVNPLAQNNSLNVISNLYWW